MLTSGSVSPVRGYMSSRLLLLSCMNKLRYTMAAIMRLRMYVKTNTRVMLTTPILPGAATIVTGYTSNTTGLISKGITAVISTVADLTTNGGSTIAGGMVTGAGMATEAGMVTGVGIDKQ